MAEVINIPAKALIYNIDIDLWEPTERSVVYSQQWDTRTRYIVATVYNNGVLYPLTASDVIHFCATKPDGYSIDNFAGIDSTGKIVYLITEQTTAKDGQFDAEFRILGGTAEAPERKGTSKFVMWIEKSAVIDNAIISSDEFNVLTQTLSSIEQLKNEVIEAVENSHDAIDSANTATTNANTAATNANSKATLANTATTNANTATTNANNAATLANQKADLADQKATLANSKATLANTATTNANTATTNANNAATLANQKADLADQKATLANTATSNANIATTNANIATTNANNATQAALNAAGDVTASNNYSLQSKRWAVGGVIPEDSSDNSKYYRDQALQYRNEAQAIVNIGIATESVPGLVKGAGNVSVTPNGDMWADPNKDKATLTGQSVQFTTADDSVIETTNIQGKYSQTTTVQGKNLFDKAKVSTVKYILPTNGVVTNSSYNNTASAFIPVNASGVYTISGHTYVQPNVPVGLAWYTNAGVYISGTSYQTATGNGTYTAPATAAYVRYTVNTTNLNVSQFESGSTATTFADFIPNSPTPDYPSKINSLGDVPFNFVTTSKNMFDGELEPGYIIVATGQNAPSTTAIRSKNYTKVNPNSTYIISKSILGGIINLRFYDAYKTFIGTSNGTVTNNNVIFNTDANTHYVRFQDNTNNLANLYQLEYGSTATSYEPYKSNQNTVSDMVLSAVPHGTKDEFISDGITAKVITRTKTTTIYNGAVTFNDLGNGNIRAGVQLDTYTVSGSGSLLLSAVCDKFTPVAVVPTAANTFYVLQSQDWTGVRINFCIPKIYLTSQDIAGVNIWLALNPITIRYTFVTPLKPQIETTHSRIFNTSYKGITNIYTTDLLQPTFTGVAKSFAWNKYYNVDSKISDITTNKAQYGDIKTLTGSSMQYLNGNDGLFEITNIKGQYNQVVTTQGKNILPDSFSEWESGQYDVSNGLKATSTSRIRLKRLVPVTPSTQYYVYSGTTSFQYAIRGYDITGAFVQSFGAALNGSTLTMPSTVYYISATLIGNPDNPTLTYNDYQTAFTNGTIKPMICLNSESNKTYTAFVPNSPSPDYPSPIVNVGDVPFNVGIYRKNLVPPTEKTSAQTVNGITFTPNTDGSISVNGTASAQTDYYLYNSFTTTTPKFYLPVGNYTLKGTGDINVRIYVGTNSQIIVSSSDGNSSVKTTNSLTGIAWYFIRIVSGATFNNFIVYPQIELGSTSTDYEPYKGNQAPISNIKLGALPGGTTDEYIYDGTNSKVISRNGRSILNGTETVSLAQTLTNTLRFTVAVAMPNRKDDDTLMLCTHFNCTVSSNASDNEHIRNPFPNTGTAPVLVVYINKARLATQDAAGFKAWLAAQYAAGTPLTVDYLLNTDLESSRERIFTTQYVGLNNINATDSLQPTLTVIAKSELWSNTYNAVYLSNESDITSAIPREADLFDGHDANYYKALINDVYTKISNPNLLINGDYFPIWQRGTSFSNHGVGTWMYTADRWRAWEVDSVTKVSTGLSIKKYSTSDYAQLATVLDERHDNKTVTASISIDGNIYKLTGVMSTTALTLPITGIGTFRVYIYNTFNFVDLVITDSNTHVVNWVKLELGSVATPIYPRTYAEELALCQRYYEKSYNTNVNPGTATTVGALFSIATAANVTNGFTFRVTKRTTPTLTIVSPGGTNNKVWINTDTDSSFTVGPQNIGENGIRYISTSTASLSVGSNITYHYIADAEIY